MFTPDSIVKLLSVPLTMGDGKQMDFANSTKQAEYFAARAKHTMEKVNYQRKDSSIVVDFCVDSLHDCNYVMYKNTQFINKWFYAYIVRKEWVSENAARLYLKTDVFQTWQFDIVLRESLVIREHTPTDKEYEHTLPEDLPSSDMIEIKRIRIQNFDMDAATKAEFDENYMIVYAMSDTVPDIEPAPGDLPVDGDFDEYLGGMPAGIRYYAITRNRIRQFWNKVNEEGRADAIIAAYVVPKYACNWVQLHPSYNPYYWVYTPNEKKFPYVKIAVAKAKTIGSTTYKNNKMLCYPYHFYRLFTCDGQSVDLKAENFTDVMTDDMRFAVTFNSQVNAELFVSPVKYCNTTVQSEGVTPEYGVRYSDFPEIPSISNAYQNYVALHKTQLALEIGKIAVKGAMQLGAGMAAMGANFVGGAAVSTLSKAAQSSKGIGMRDISTALGGDSGIMETASDGLSLFAQMHDMKRQPERSNGRASGCTLQQNNCAGIYLAEVRMREEYMDMIDKYFTMYGYKVMIMKEPQYKSRKRFNYLKTADIDISGNLPQDDLQELCAMFNNGITVWHMSNGVSFGSYAGDNSPA